MLLKTAIGLMLLSTVLWSPAALANKCLGLTPCDACKNCHYCKRCSQQGGTCGTCKGGRAASVNEQYHSVARRLKEHS